MKISTKGRYALRLMLDLAMNNNGDYISIKTISSRQEISEKYLEQIITILNRAGFVKSIRGPQGGYKLTHSPAFYTVGMILRLTEGELAPVSCLEEEQNQCKRSSFCPTLYVWEKLKDSIDSVVDSITLEDIINHAEIHSLSPDSI